MNKKAWVFYAIVAFAVIVHQLKRVELEHQLVELKIQKAVLDRVTQAMLALRDLSNTPIQAIKATTALLREENISISEIMRINKLALERLGELSRTMETYEHQVDSSMSDYSFDAMAVLKEVLESSRKEKNN